MDLVEEGSGHKIPIQNVIVIGRGKGVLKNFVEECLEAEHIELSVGEDKECITIKNARIFLFFI
jgi:hypothetical protein